jgi:hypothetical protein
MPPWLRDDRSPIACAALRIRPDAALAIACTALGACATAPRFDGPLPVRSQHPAQLTVLQIVPESAAPMPAWEARLRADTAYSSLFLFGQGGGNDLALDGELGRSALRTTIGLGGGAELGIEFAGVHSGGGFLDEFVIDWHDFWGFPDQGRSQAPRDAFQVRAREGGQTVYRMEPENWTLADIPITFGWAPIVAREGQPWSVMLRAAIEAPAGDDERGYGSGNWESALGLTCERRIGPVALTGHLQHAFAETPQPGRSLGFEFEDVTAAAFAAEVALDDTWSLLAQVGFETSTLRDLGFRQAERDQWLLWLGARARLDPRFAIEFAFGEDIESHVAPDFTAYVSFLLSLGGSPLELPGR